MDDTNWIGDSGCGTLLSACVIGANHRDKGLPCQDASLAAIRYYKGQAYALLAVADGHGAARYTRSELGAHFAVQAADEAVARWVIFAAESLAQPLDAGLDNLRNDFGTNFARTLRQAWLRHVDEHLASHPLGATGDEPRDDHGIYGTTVALALIFREHVFVGAIGDSTVLIVRNDNHAIDVLASDRGAGLLGLITHSLAQEDAALKWKHRVLPMDDVGLVCAVTDGFTDSLADVCGTLAQLQRDARTKGLGWMRAKLPDFLLRLTAQGVGDDITTGWYFPPEQQADRIDAPAEPEPPADDQTRAGNNPEVDAE